MLFPSFVFAADGDITLTVTPSSATFGTEPLRLVVMLDNGSAASITNATLAWALNGVAEISAVPTASTPRSAPAGAVLTWDVELLTKGPGVDVTFRVSFRSQEPAAGDATPAPAVDRVLLATLSVDPAPDLASFTVDPAAIELSESTSSIVNVVVLNTSSRPITVVVQAPSDGSISISPDKQTGVLGIGDSVALPFVVTASSRLSPGEHALTFALTTRAEGMPERLSTIATKVTLSTEPIASISVEGSEGDLTEQSPVGLTVIVTNGSGAEITATIAARADPMINFCTRETSVVLAERPPVTQPGPMAHAPLPTPGPCPTAATVGIGSGDQAGVAFELKAARRVLSGSRSVIFDVDLISGGQTRHFVVTHPVTLSVLGADLLETPLGIPAFYIIPGVIIAVVWSWIWKLFGPLRTTTFSVTAFDKEFWILAIALSFGFSFAYSFINQIVFKEQVDLLGSTGYGTADVLRIWGLSFLFPALVYLGWRGFQELWRRNEINPRDKPLSVIRKMGPISPSRPTVEVDGHRGFLASDTVQSEGLWVIPPIEVEWYPSASVATQQQLDAQLNADGSVAAIGQVLEPAVLAGHAAVRYETAGTFVRPRKLSPEDAALGAPDLIVTAS